MWGAAPAVSSARPLGPAVSSTRPLGTGCFFRTATGTGCFFGTATGTGCFFCTATGTGCFFCTATETGASSLHVFLHLPLLFFSSRVSSVASPFLVFLFLHLPLLFFSSRVSSIASPLLLFTCFFNCLSSSRLLVFSNLSHGFCLACHNISVACDLCVGGEATSDGNDQLQG